MNLTVTIPDDRVDDLAAAIKQGPSNVPWRGAPPNLESEASGEDEIQAWLTDHVRSMLWDWDRRVAADATPDPLA